MNDNKEFVETIGLIVGGTEYQPIHNDVVKTKANKKMYDDVMAMDNPPAALLLGFAHPVRIGVQKQDVTYCDKDGSEDFCTVDSSLDDTFLVVSDKTVFHRRDDRTIQTTDLVTLQGDYGFCFKGNFKHAGAPMVLTPGSPDVAVWNKVRTILQPLVNKELCAEDHWDVFTKLCNVKSLNKITRLHVELCPILPDGKKFIIDHNAVGIYANGTNEDILTTRRNKRDADIEETPYIEID